MLLFCDSFSHYATAQIQDKYPPVAFDPPSLVTIVPGAGRLGGGAAYFDNTLGYDCRVSRAVATAAADQTLTLGCAVRFTTLPALAATLLSLVVTHPLAPPDIHINLEAVSTAGYTGCTFRVSASVGTLSTMPGLVLQTPLDQMLPLGATGYVELQVALSSNFGTGPGHAILRLTGYAYDYCSFAGESGSFTGIQLGGQTPATTGVEDGTWYLCDLYVTDGSGGFNPGFLGDVHIEALFPTQDGYQITLDNTPWVTSAEALGNPHYLQLNSPIAPDLTGAREMGYATGNISSFLFTHPLAGTTIAETGELYGYTAGAPWDLIAVQWVARVRTLSAATPSITPIIRRLAGGTIPTDTIYPGPVIPLPPGTLPGFTTYAFACAPYDYNPTTGEAWDMAGLLLQPTPGVIDTIEIGIQKVPGVA